MCVCVYVYVCLCVCVWIGNSIGDDGVKAFAQCLPRLSQLTFLSLCGALAATFPFVLDLSLTITLTLCVNV